jgi:non-homologous end joining protein Ku
MKLSFVTCPIALFPAVTPAERISFRQVNRNTGHRLKQQLVDVAVEAGAAVAAGCCVLAGGLD